MNKTIYVILILTLIANICLASKVVIEGYAPEYAGKELSIYTYKDFITLEEKELVTQRVEWNGDFKISFHIDETMYCFMYLGIFKAYIYLEPGKSYYVKLPPDKPKTTAQKLNPYFEYNEVYLVIQTPEDELLNKSISKLENTYGKYLTDNAPLLYRGRKPENYTQFIDSVASAYESTDNGFFKSYLTYKLGYIDFIANTSKMKYIFEHYFKHKPARFSNPAYMSLFREVAFEYLNILFDKEDGKTFYKMIKDNEDIFKIKQYFSRITYIDDDDFIELFLLQVLHSGFYKNDFNYEIITNCCNQIIKNSSIEQHLAIAENIKNKINRLREGTPAPDFSLQGLNDEIYNLNKFKGKYLYLNFCTTKSYACQNDFALMQKIHQKYYRELDILTICIDESKEEIVKLFENNNYKWPVVQYADSSNVLKNYNIKVYPTYYLIDPDGYLTQSPAMAPSDDFVPRFFEIWNKSRYQKHRDEKK